MTDNDGTTGFGSQGDGQVGYMENKAVVLGGK